MNRLDKSEIIFKVIAYVSLTIFAIFCLYPLIYTIAGAFSSKSAMNAGKVILFPVEFQIDAFQAVLLDNTFWLRYCNTIFYTFYGTLVSMAISIAGAYALSKEKLMFRRGWNFALVFTMWFSAGVIPSYINYLKLGVNNRWGVIFCLGFNAFNVILLRNYFRDIPHEIEEAATIDGANDFQILTKIYMPMSKASIAVVTLFYALSRWNGYFWSWKLLVNPLEQPLMVYIKACMTDQDNTEISLPYHTDSYMYAMLICSIIPIIILYPQMQKYFATGVNVGGVKE